MDYESSVFLLSNGTARWNGRQIPIRTVQFGELRVTTGSILTCDPFDDPEMGNCVPAPNGSHPVFTTLADVSEESDGSHLREAYLSVMFADSRIARVKDVGTAVVEAGTVGFADGSMLTMTPEDGWRSASDPWAVSMDDPGHFFDGVANIPVLEEHPDVNLAVCWSGWGDGGYSVLASYDDDGELNGLHVDLLVLGEGPLDENAD